MVKGCDLVVANSFVGGGHHIERQKALTLKFFSTSRLTPTTDLVSKPTQGHQLSDAPLTFAYFTRKPHPYIAHPISVQGCVLDVHTKAVITWNCGICMSRQ